MKYRHIIFSAALSLALFVSAGAQAASIFNSTDLGTLSLGQSGTTNIVNVGGTSSVVHDFVEGAIPANSMITFTYSFAGVSDKGPYSLTGDGTYDYTHGTTPYSGWVHTNSHGGDSWGAKVNGGNSSEQLAFATAALAGNLTGGTVTFNNLSKGLMWFSAEFLGKIMNGYSEASWKVSAVPLPAALPLFGAGLLGLAGLGRFRKSRKSV